MQESLPVFFRRALVLLACPAPFAWDTPVQCIMWLPGAMKEPFFDDTDRQNFLNTFQHVRIYSSTNILPAGWKRSIIQPRAGKAAADTRISRTEVI